MNHPPSHGADAAVLPAIIQRYLRAHDDLDTDTTLQTFGATAEVTDEGETRQGHAQIRRWLKTTSSAYTFERNLIGVSTEGDDQWVVMNNITGNFPGGTVDLAYRFTLRNNLIHQLVIAQVEAGANTEHG
jgi:hypothetical protein